MKQRRYLSTNLHGVEQVQRREVGLHFGVLPELVLQVTLPLLQQCVVEPPEELGLCQSCLVGLAHLQVAKGGLLIMVLETVGTAMDLKMRNTK